MTSDDQSPEQSPDQSADHGIPRWTWLDMLLGSIILASFGALLALIQWGLFR